MTAEQLDEIEKLLAEFWDGSIPYNPKLGVEIADRAEPLVKALREAWTALDQVSSDDRMSEAQITAAITEAQKERDEARAEVERLRGLIDTVIRNCMECYDKRECQSCAWLREGTEKKR